MRQLYMITLLAVLCCACACGSKPQPADPSESAPAAPVNLALHGQAGENSLTFQWDAVPGATGYQWTLTLGGNELKNGSSTARNTKVEGLTKATDYRFGVKAVNQHGESAYTWVDARTAGEETPGPGPLPQGIAYEDFGIPACEEDGTARAFPGAEGGGMFTAGGRGGKVIHVTNLNDKGTGSLRAAIEEKGPRTVVFDVAGIIELQSPLKIQNGSLTIAGQTAPGDGICLKNYTLHIQAGDVIIRFIRCRMGDEKKTEDDAMNLNAGSDNVRNVMVDHCSLSWSTDECASFYGVTNFSLQWCILSESLRNSIHDKGKHGYGGLWGGENATYHHNLLAHHDSRNPRLDHDYLSLLKGPVGVYNNVIYNWGDNSTYGGESANETGEYRRYNVVNNYYKPGPATASGKVRFLDPWTGACSNCTKKTGCSTIVPGHFYMDGNVMDGKDNLTADNWAGTTASASVISSIRAQERFTYAAQPAFLGLHAARDAFGAVTGFAGASLRRDFVDERIARETQDGTYTYEGSKGSSKGFVDTQGDVGGWPSYGASQAETAAMKDSDGDGIPDLIEDAWGLDKTLAADGNAMSLDKHGRYTNLEMYLHYLVREIVSGQARKSTYIEL